MQLIRRIADPEILVYVCLIGERKREEERADVHGCSVSIHDRHSC